MRLFNCQEGFSVFRNIKIEIEILCIAFSTTCKKKFTSSKLFFESDFCGAFIIGKKPQNYDYDKNFLFMGRNTARNSCVIQFVSNAFKSGARV